MDIETFAAKAPNGEKFFDELENLYAPILWDIYINNFRKIPTEELTPYLLYCCFFPSPMSEDQFNKHVCTYWTEYYNNLKGNE